MEPNQPQEDPQHILKKARTSLLALKETLKTKEPHDKEAEFHRKDARRQYIHLIFDFPYSPQTLALDNIMWMETSHSIIQVYRGRLATLDKVISKLTKAREKEKEKQSKDNANEGGKNSLAFKEYEHRKILQRFRQFLTEEEKFWTVFITRFVRSFSLDFAKPHIDALGLTKYDDSSRKSGYPEERKNGFPEDKDPVKVPEKYKERKVAVLTKAIISLGDLARYKEQYNERDGRPKAGAEENPPRWVNKVQYPNQAAEELGRPRNYARALMCYSQARSLYPDQGHASHQMAILAGYQGDTFESILHYYRALTVKHPFTMAFDNLLKMLEKIHASFVKDGGFEANLKAVQEKNSPRGLIDQFKKDISILHSFWRSDQVTMAELDEQTKHVLCRFNLLTAARLLPIGFTHKVYIAALGALYTFRPLPTKQGISSSQPASPVRGMNVEKGPDTMKEKLVLTHLMELHLSLVRIGALQISSEGLIDETVGAGRGSGGNYGHEKMTPILRRISQALRLASRWLAANLEYIYTTALPVSSSDILQPNQSDSDLRLRKVEDGLTRVLGEFWPAYAQLITKLARIFTLKNMHIGSVPLEEEFEYSAFTPLKGTLVPAKEIGRDGGEVRHKDLGRLDEYLRRMRYLLADAEIVLNSDFSPLIIQDGNVVSKTEVFTPFSSPPVSKSSRVLIPTKSGDSIPEDGPTFLIVRKMDDPLDYSVKRYEPDPPVPKKKKGEEEKKDDDSSSGRMNGVDRVRVAEEKTKEAVLEWNRKMGRDGWINYSPMNPAMRLERQEKMATVAKVDIIKPEAAPKHDTKKSDGVLDLNRTLKSEPMSHQDGALQLKIIGEPEKMKEIRAEFPRQVLEDRLKRANGQSRRSEETPRKFDESHTVVSSPTKAGGGTKSRLTLDLIQPMPGLGLNLIGMENGPETPKRGMNDETASRGSGDRQSRVDEDDIASVSTEDPVTMAMRATLNVSDEEDDGFEEDILYPRDSWTGLDNDYGVTIPSKSHPPGPLPPSAFRQVPATIHDMQPPPSQAFPHHDVFGPGSPDNHLIRQAHPPMPMNAFNLSSGPGGQSTSRWPPQAPNQHQFYPSQPFYPQNTPQFQGGWIGGIPPPNQMHPPPGMFDNAPPQMPPNGYGPPMSMDPNGMGPPQANQRHRYQTSMNFNVNSGPPMNAGRSMSMDAGPKTAQDLLARVLGAGGGQPSGSNPSDAFMHLNQPHQNPNFMPNFPPNLGENRSSQHPPFPQKGPNNPLRNQRAPPIYGGQGGNSIWAP